MAGGGEETDPDFEPTDPAVVPLAEPFFTGESPVPSVVVVPYLSSRGHD